MCVELCWVRAGEATRCDLQVVVVVCDRRDPNGVVPCSGVWFAGPYWSSVIRSLWSGL